MIKGVVIDITTAKLSQSLADAPAPSQQQADDQEDELQVRQQASYTTHQAVRHKSEAEFLVLHRGPETWAAHVSVWNADAVCCAGRTWCWTRTWGPRSRPLARLPVPTTTSPCHR